MDYGKTPCKVCKELFQKRCANHQVCDVCHPAHKRADNAARLRRYREKRGVKKVGSIKQCSDCEADFKYIAGPQHRCKDCQKKYNIERIHGWLSINSIRNGEYKKTAKENYYYSGNRIPAHERDGCKCVRCDAVDSLNCHHIDGMGKGLPKSERNDSLDNLATLCGNCHQQLHAETARRLYRLHPDTVLEVFNEFVYSH